METKFFSLRSNQVLGSLVLLMIVIALGMYSTFTWRQSEYLYSGPTTISVSGESEVSAIPDIGEFSFSVNAEGKTAALAQEESATKINAILASLKEQGVEEKDIKTQNYNLYPKYRYEQRPCPVGTYCPPGEQVMDGFEVTQTVRVKVRAVDTAGDLISQVGDLGATNISSLAFTIDDDSVLKDQARSEAIAEAKVKAKILAKQLGVRLDRMINYYEDENGGPMPYYGMGGDMMAKTAMESSVSPELPVGENVTKSRVTITYQVR